MIDVYIACAVTDRAKARILASLLHMQGYTVAPATLLDRTANLNESETAIDAKCVVVLWTQASINSQPVRSDASVGAQRECLIELVFGPHRAHIDGVTSVPIDFMKWDGSAHERQWRQLSQRVRDYAGGGNGRVMDRNTLTQAGVIGALVTVSVGVMAMTLSARLEPTSAPTNPIETTAENKTPDSGALNLEHIAATQAGEAAATGRDLFEDAHRSATDVGAAPFGGMGGPNHIGRQDKGWEVIEGASPARAAPKRERPPAEEEEKTPEPMGPAP
jgi:hypothetical protein